MRIYVFLKDGGQLEYENVVDYQHDSKDNSLFIKRNVSEYKFRLTYIPLDSIERYFMEDSRKNEV